MLCAVIVITGLCDFLKTMVDIFQNNNDIPNYQIFSPLVLLLSAVSVCVCMCMCVCVIIIIIIKNICNGDCKRGFI